VTHDPSHRPASPGTLASISVNHEISPEPDEAERTAILEALAAEEAAQEGISPWAAALLPQRDEDDPPDP
jgi:hypothetical protein